MYKYAERMENLSGNAIREIFKLLEDPEVISFAGGMPAAEALPVAQVKEFANKLLSQPNADSLLQYGSTEGFLPLRQNILTFLERTGIKNQKVANTLIVSGGQQGIDLTCKVFINKGDYVLVEKPTYLAVLHILKTYQANVIGVDSDKDGLNIDDLKQKIAKYNPKLLYLVPNFSNPTGKTLNIEKRKQIAQIVEDNDIVLLEDDPYRELRYSGEPLPSIKSFDKSDKIIYLTSFSKTIGPALRVGAVVAGEELIRKLTIGKQATDVHTATLNQAIVNEFITSGVLDENVKKYIPLYRQKRDAMIEAIKKYFPECEYTNSQGGLFIFVTFKNIDAKSMFVKAVSEYKVAYVTGNDFFADGSGNNTIRLNFSNASFERIERGIKALGKMFKGGND